MTDGLQRTPITLYDTLTRQTKQLRWLQGQPFRFYCCGPTVYGPAHIGNFRTFVLQDVLCRTLRVLGVPVLHIRNITDVDDKTITRSQEAGVSLQEFTHQWALKFHQDCQALGLLQPDVEPCATAHIPEQIALIQQLLARGHAYVGGDQSVYYQVSSFARYGALAHLDQVQLRSQAVTSGGVANRADEYQRDQVADFALWKAHKDTDGENAWDSPWGPGRPGWHIECSAMSMKYLGDTLDLHGGGVDLCFPHHENEIAQSEGATGQPFARHWFHSAHLMVEGQKMSKSLGNLLTLSALQDQGHAPLAVRYLLLSGHYRQPFNFTMAGLHAAASALAKLRKIALGLAQKANQSLAAALSWRPEPLTEESYECLAPAWQALANDLNTPAALGALFNAALGTLEGRAAVAAWPSFRALLYALGLQEVCSEEAAAAIPDDIAALAAARWEAKKARDFATADQLRAQIAQRGWDVLDRKSGFELSVSKH